jgi:hypothetical protein
MMKREETKKPGEPCQIYFMRLQELYSPEVSNYLCVLFALIYLEADKCYAKAYPKFVSILSSNYLKSYPFKDLELAAMRGLWSSKPYSRLLRLTYH